MNDPFGPSNLHILDFVPSGCCVLVDDGVIDFWSRTLEHWTGLRSPEIVGKSLFQVFPGLAEPRYRDRILAALRQGVPTLFSSALNPSFFPCTKPSGRPRIQETTLVRLDPSVQGQHRLLIVVNDVTEQVERGEKYRSARSQALKEAQERRESEERRRIIADLSMASILIGDPGGHIREANSASCRMFGWEAAEFENLSLFDLVQEPVRLNPLILGESDLGEEDLEILCQRKDGTPFPAHVYIRRLALGEGSQFVAYVWDISERKRSEEILRQSQKQESLGILAGGIAHDFNNHFGGVIGNLDLIESKLPPDSPIASYLDKVRREILRATELSRKMLALSGGNPLVVAEVELNAFLRKIRGDLKGILPAWAELRFDFASGPVVVEADESQIQQVIFGLLTNAGESLSQGKGLVEITTGNTVLDGDTLASSFPLQPLEPGTYGFLRVRDTGCGIPSDHLQKVFDPFFSTKFSGRGLSLAFIRSILQAHAGGWSLESSLGHGTVFTVYLPIRPEAQRVSAPPPQALPSSVADGIILVVDDELVLRESTAELLHELGYRVETAGNGLEALNYYQAHPGQVALVLMDMTMPVMGGKEAFLAIRDLDPQAKVVLTSGYSEQDVTQSFRNGELVAFLPKPYRMMDLAKVVGGAVGLP
ncbi:PAS domain-containing hybrid sensor histidine kinase/response regulator [Holophaga foetida]|uniref:PAS domain-containing hybrid sensor histidine kinase/response regulator n=1 Tax=Holophaga foetida TaxID=35839 RepID=UPI00024752FE|nr:PAS domain S-box protein [Holophaga foetida]